MVNEKENPVHNYMDGESHIGFSQEHEDQKNDPREESPGRAEDEVARSGADKG